MYELFKNKYRIKSIRLEHWDYSSNGAYFVTICTKNRINYLGEIINGKMELSEIGGITKNELLKIPMLRNNVLLDEWVIMPNHVHIIFIIDMIPPFVETCLGMSLRAKYNRFSKPISGSLSMIVNQYKSAVKRECNKSNFRQFTWQPRFYERIIRNENELNRTREYIINNPIKWEFDRNRFN
jgi:REP element-mobilizing transposase RayT